MLWAWSVAAAGLLFRLLPAYGRLSWETRLWFRAFFLSVMAFFLLLLAVWSDPFAPWRDLPGRSAPVDGFGLNPQLQTLGMILHPPLLFLGYGGFVVPGCLALAQTLVGRGSPAWESLGRPFILGSWSLLTAGIILGAWWAYRELGWGGYWAWDPVENASLLPWLAATACLHTAVILRRSGKLARVSAFLMALTTVSAFFATYLTRGGAEASLHSFAASGVSSPLLAFALAGLGLSAGICLAAPRRTDREMAHPLSGEGMLVLLAWTLLALYGVILLATLSPALVRGLRALPLAAFQSLDLPALGAGFYNRACLPLFTLPALLLVLCPFLRRERPLAPGGARSFLAPALMLAALGSPLLSRLAPLEGGVERLAPLVFLAGFILFFLPGRRNEGFFLPGVLRGTLILLALAGLLLFRLGLEQPVALVAAASSLAGAGGLAALFAVRPVLFARRASAAAGGAHLGLLLLILGVAISGPYQARHTLVLGPGESASLGGGYSVRLTALKAEGVELRPDGEARYRFSQADLALSQEGRALGVLSPQIRRYARFDRQPYGQVATLFSLGNEIYATLLRLGDDGRAALMLQINPLINWIWLGGLLLCLFPLLGTGRAQRPQAAEEGQSP
ncbi:MAG: cytochrome c biogenesis protein CcsA [Desulfovibrio sp.]|nr:cytochrome c biogenesis protein CcsA [Desulfovibrio sp.]